MNFFGHAAIAAGFGRDPEFLFGSMLPDFVGMIRARPPEANTRNLATGIQFHHLTDAAFHGAPRFLALTMEADHRLSELALPRGPARALAHVGVEILLDQALVLERAHRQAFVDGLSCQLRPGDLVFRSSEDAGRLADLVLRLREAQLPSGDETPTEIAWRLRRILSGRPRLAVPPEHEPAVATWVKEFRPRVYGARPELMAQLLERLGPYSFTSTKPGGG